MAKRKEWPQCHRESCWQIRQSRFLQNEKEQSRLSRLLRSSYFEAYTKLYHKPHKSGVNQLKTPGKNNDCILVLPANIKLTRSYQATNYQQRLYLTRYKFTLFFPLSNQPDHHMVEGNAFVYRG